MLRMNRSDIEHGLVFLTEDRGFVKKNIYRQVCVHCVENGPIHAETMLTTVV